MACEITTVEQYLTQLPEDRRAILETVRATILKSLPVSYVEGINCGMIGHFVHGSFIRLVITVTPHRPCPLPLRHRRKSRWHCIAWAFTAIQTKRLCFERPAAQR